MHRHYSTGVATLVALMAAHREAISWMREEPPAPRDHCPVGDPSSAALLFGQNGDKGNAAYEGRSESHQLSE